MTANSNYLSVERTLRQLQRTVNGAREMQDFLRQIRIILDENNNYLPFSRSVSPEMVIIDSENQNNLTCSVCLDDFCLSEIVKELPCKHKFHPDCIGNWLENHNTCPMCRRRIVHRRIMESTTQTGSHHLPTRDTEQRGTSADAAASALTSTESTQTPPVDTTADVQANHAGAPMTRSRAAATAEQMAQQQAIYRRITRQMSRQLEEGQRRSNRG